MKKKFIASLLALCIVLALLPVQALAADSTEPLLPLDNVEEEPESPEELTGVEDDVAIFSEPLQVPEDAAPDTASVQSTAEVTVETRDAENITDFTADTPLIASSPEMYELMKDSGVRFGVEYQAEGQTRLYTKEAEMGDDSVPGNGVTFEWLTALTKVKCTFRIPCMPSTTYRYRAYCMMLKTGEYIYGEWKTFTTGGLTAQPINPDIFVPVKASQPEQYTYTPTEDGFYTSSVTADADTTGTGWLSVLNTQNNSWETFSQARFFETGSTQYIQLSASEDGNYKADISPLVPTQLTLNEPQSVSRQDNASAMWYYGFTPETSGYYTLSAEAENENHRFSVWDAVNKSWTRSSPSLTVYMTAGTVQYIQFTVYTSDVYTVQISPFISSVDTFSVETGEARPWDNGIRSDISITAIAPIGSSFRVGIEFQSEAGNNRYSTNWIENCTSERQTISTQLQTLPNTRYSYRAYLEPITDGMVSGEAVYGEWREFTSPGSITPLALGQPASGNPNQETVYSFTPEETGYYVVSAASDNTRVYLWDTARCSWNTLNSSQPLRIEAGETRYVETYSSYASYTITLERFVSTVTTYSISAAEIENVQVFYAGVHIKGAVPLGSSLRIGVEYWAENGDKLSEGNSYSDYPREVLDEYITLRILPNTTYHYRAYLIPDNGETVYGEEQSFTASSPDMTELRLNSPQTVTATSADYGYRYFSFTPTAAGYYTVAVTGDVSDWALRNAATGYWDSAMPTGGNSLTVFMDAGVAQYAQIYAKPGISCEISVSRFNPTVTSFSVETGDAQNISGFTADIPLSISVPIGSNFQAGIEYELKDGGWNRQHGGGSESSTSEHPAVTVQLQTLPGRTYRYRAFLHESDDYENPIYGTWKTFTAASDDSKAVTLELDSAQVIQPDYSSYNRTKFFKFTPTEAGYYMVSVEGENGQMNTADMAREDWITGYFSGSRSVTHKLEAGSPLYVSLLTYGSSCTIKVTRVTPTATEFSVVTETAFVSGLQLQIPVTVKAPLGSDLSYGVRCDIRNLTDSSPARGEWIQGSAAEEMSETFAVPVIPGKTYNYQAYIINASTGQFYYGAAYSITIPEQQEAPELTLGEVKTGAASLEAYYTFTPEKTGSYTFSVTGGYGSLFVLKEDGGVIEKSYSAKTELVLELTAGEKVHLIQIEQQGGQYSLVVERKVLSAIKSTRGIDVQLEAESAGTYIFAVYNRAGQTLQYRVCREQAAGNSISFSFPVVSGASYVKAFTLDPSTYAPLAPVEQAQIASAIDK